MNLLSCAVTAVPTPDFAPSFGDLIPLEQFIRMCQLRALVDSDGWGEYSDGVFIDDMPFKFTEQHDYEYGMSDLEPTHCGICNRYRQRVYPHLVPNGLLDPPQWATHVVWYNR